MSNEPSVPVPAEMSADAPESKQDAVGAGEHPDKYNDPRAKITGRGIWIGVAVTVFAVLGAAGSIYARKTPIEKTKAFWGEETITGLQLAERMELLPRGAETFARVELTTTPGLGHLRQALLDERNFDWETVEQQSVASTCSAKTNDEPTCIQLRLTDPTGHRIGTIEMDINLVGGWVGPSDGSQRVRINDWARPKMKSYFATVINVEQKRYDLRDNDSEEKL